MPLEALPAGVVEARLAPAVPAPVAHALGRATIDGVVGEHGSTFSHRNVVGGVEAQRAECPERSHFAAAIGGAERIAAVLHQQQIMFLGEGGDRGQVKRVAQRVRHHDGAGARAKRLLQPGDVDVVSRNVHIQEHRNQPVLDERVDGGRKPGRTGYNLVAGL